MPELEGQPQPFQDPVFLQLFEVAKIANFSPAEQASYQSSLKYYRDLNNVIDTSWQEGREQGRADEARSLILRQLARRIGSLPETVQAQVEALPLSALEILEEALLDFETLSDVQRWLSDQR